MNSRKGQGRKEQGVNEGGREGEIMGIWGG